MKLKRTDIKVLQRCLKSNGGGVDFGYGYDSAIKRLLKANYIQYKPNQEKSKHWAILMTLTPLSKQAILGMNHEN